jgi:scyllo-inositol 2-dehydrogenase (NADP+)
VALVGFGPAGAGLHAPLIGRTDGLELAAVVTADPDRRDQVQRDWPDAAVLGSADQIWGRAEEYGLVVVAAPNRAHAAAAGEAMRAGLPVVVDKPLASSLGEAERLVALSRETGVPLAVFHNRRWDGDFLAVRELLEAGRLGRVTRLEARWERWRADVAERWRESDDPADAGGLLWDLGSHLIDQALALFGLPEGVYAEMDRRRPGARVDDDTFVSLRYPAGPTVALFMSMVVRDPGPRFRVIGSEGQFESRGLDPQELRLRGDQAPEVDARLLTDEGEEQLEVPAGDYGRFYARVRDALSSGGPMPVTGEEGLATVRVIEAARTAAREGRAVSLAEGAEG